MMFPKKARVESGLLGQACLFYNFVHASGQVLSERRVGDGTVDSEFHEIPPYFAGCPIRIISKSVLCELSNAPFHYISCVR
jgi:hypothetical protein